MHIANISSAAAEPDVAGTAGPGVDTAPSSEASGLFALLLGKIRAADGETQVRVPETVEADPEAGQPAEAADEPETASAEDGTDLTVNAGLVLAAVETARPCLPGQAGGDEGLSVAATASAGPARARAVPVETMPGPQPAPDSAVTADSSNVAAAPPGLAQSGQACDETLPPAQPQVPPPAEPPVLPAAPASNAAGESQRLGGLAPPGHAPDGATTALPAHDMASGTGDLVQPIEGATAPQAGGSGQDLGPPIDSRSGGSGSGGAEAQSLFEVVAMDNQRSSDALAPGEGETTSPEDGSGVARASPVTAQSEVPVVARVADTVVSAGPSGPQAPGELAVTGVRYLVGRNEQSLTIRLSPASLGELHIEVTSADDVVQVRLVSGSSVVREVLGGQLDHLRATLASEGIDVGRVLVSAAMTGDTQPDHAFYKAADDPGASGHAPEDPWAEAEPFPERPSSPPHRGVLNVFV